MIKPALAVVAVLIASAAAAPDAIICVTTDDAAGRCGAASELAAEIANRPHARIDEANAVVTLIETTDASRIADNELSSIGVLVEADHDAPRAREVSLRFERAGDERRWAVVLPARWIGDEWSLRLPRGTYRIEVAVDGHEPHRAEIRADDARGRLHARLRGRPAIRGAVVSSASGEPLAGVTVESESGELLATTDLAGRFRFEPELDDWPALIRFRHPAHAQLLIAVPPALTTHELPTVELPSGVAVDVRISGDDADVEAVTLARRGRNLTHPVVERKPVPAAAADSERAVAFDRVAPGKYVVIVEGKEPLQRLAVPLEVEGEPLALDAIISEYELDISVRRGDSPLEPANVKLIHIAEGWSATLPIERSPRSARLWQEGRFAVIVRSPSLSNAHTVETDVASSDRELVVEVPATAVRGMVVASGTDKPIAGARVSLTFGWRGVFLAYTGDDGRFEFTGVPAGQHELAAHAAGYTASRKLPLRVREGMPLVDGLALELRPSVAAATIRVAHSNGMPAAGASVLVLDRNGVSASAQTGADGSARIPAEAGRQLRVIVIAREGSFTVAEVTSSGSADRVEEVALPPAAASLRLVTKGQDGDVVPNVALVLRFNGVLLPLDAIDELRRIQGLVFATGPGGEMLLPRLPVGFYEFWPVGSREELVAVFQNAGPRAPVQIGLNAGANEATLTFRKR